jgi:hypothetical protein
MKGFIVYLAARKRRLEIEKAIARATQGPPECIVINDPTEGLEDYVILNLSVYEIVQIGAYPQPGLDDKTDGQKYAPD